MRKCILEYMAIGLIEEDAIEVVEMAIEASVRLPVSATKLISDLLIVLAYRGIKDPGAKKLARLYLGAIEKSHYYIPPACYIAISELCVRADRHLNI